MSDEKMTAENTFNTDFTEAENNVSENVQNSPVRRWTAAQSAAIDYKGRGLLLSAGAGSGKTATLTEKVCRLVCDEENGIPISEMIIVTYTRAAAGELRERIAAKLSEKINESPTPFLVRQMIDLESAEISTILSFFLRAVKPHFSALGLPPTFGVAEPAVIKGLKEKVMADTVDLFFERRDEDFTALADTLGSSRSEDYINERLLEVAEKMAAKGLDAEVMAKWAEELQRDSECDFLSSPHGKLLLESTRLFAEHYLNVYAYYGAKFGTVEEEGTRKSYGDAFESDSEFFEKLKALTEKGTYKEVRELVTEHVPKNLGKIKSATTTSVSFKNMRDTMKKEAAALAAKYTADEDSVSEVQSRTALLCRATAKVLAEYFTAFETEKKERGIVDYSDLEIYADKIFCNPDGSPTAAALDFSKNFRCIFIDEYQDTNKIQDRVFTALSHGMKRFMVGDVKQSIYAFRGSEPQVFTAYREKWGELSPDAASECGEESEYTLFMNENFRSDSTVTEFVNLVSAYMFPDTATPFEDGDRLVFSRKTDSGYRETKTEVCLIEKPSKKRSKTDSSEGQDEESPIFDCPEAEYTADRIAAMINGETLGDGSLIRPSDVTILMRSSTQADKYADALKRRGIPVKNRANDEFFEQSEVLLVLCILNAIDNPLRDIYLAGAMKSPVFGFSVDDMIKLLDYRNKSLGAPLWYCVEEYLEKGGDAQLRLKCADLCDFLSEFRLKAPGMSASRLLSELYDSLSLYSLTDGADASENTCRRIRANLTRLYEYARSFEDDSYGGLHGFITHVCELMEGTVETGGDEDDRDAVSIMNIHKSKGLEFPVCFLCECSKKFNRIDLSNDVLFDAEIGLAMKLQDDTGLVKCDTPLRGLLSEKMRVDQGFEETRILYVAMTRAVERLVVTMTFSDCESAKKDAYDKYLLTSAYIKRNASSFSDLILPAVMGALYENRSDCFTLKTVKLSEIGFSKVQTEFEAETAEKEREDLSELYAERLSFRYEKSHLANIPAKVTVSKLRPAFLDEDEEILDIDKFSAENSEDSETAFGSLSENGECVKSATPLMGTAEGESTFETGAARDVPRPRFLSDKGAAKATDIGTATHVFLQFADFDRLRTEGAEKELERLREKRFITEQMAALVDLEQIDLFIQSDLFAALEKAEGVRREFRFNVALPASDFTKNQSLAEKLMESGTMLTTQGVIDLVFTDENGELILVDYKTDRLTKAELADRRLAEAKLRERHRLQLTYYKTAVEKMFGRSVYKVAIYSLPLGDTVDIL